jgi:hypothetical protein
MTVGRGGFGTPATSCFSSAAERMLCQLWTPKGDRKERAPDLPQLGGPIITSTAVGSSARPSMRLCSSASRLKKAPRHTPAVSAASPAVAASVMLRRPGCSTVKGWQTARPDAASCAPGCDACDATWSLERGSAQASAAQAAPLARARRCCTHATARSRQARGVRVAPRAARPPRASSAVERGGILAAGAQPPAQARRRRPRHDASGTKHPAAVHGRRQARGQRAALRRSESSRLPPAQPPASSAASSSAPAIPSAPPPHGRGVREIVDFSRDDHAQPGRDQKWRCCAPATCAPTPGRPPCVARRRLAAPVGPAN